MREKIQNILSEPKMEMPWDEAALWYED